MATTKDIERLVRTYIDPTVTDNIYNATPLLKRFRSKAKMRNGLGRYIVEPLESEVGLASSYAELATVDRTRKEVTQSAQYNLSQYYSPLTVSWKDQLTCRGPEDVVELLMVKARNAEKDLARKLTTDLVSGTGTGTAGEPTIVGLATMLPTSDGTVGGLAQATYTWWRNQRAPIGGSMSLVKWVSAYASTMDGNEKATVAITDKYIWAYIWGSLLTDKEMYTTGEYNMPGDLPAVSGLPVLVDYALENGAGATGGKVYMVNEDYLFLRVHSADNFKRWPYEKPVDQFAYSTFWTWSGALCNTASKRHCVCSGVTT